jgi:pilus assembly protein CpaB
MKSKTLVLMLVAGGCGLAAAFMTSKYLASQAQQPQKQEEEIPVLFAKQAIPGNSLLRDPKAFQVKLVRKSDASKDAIGDFEQAKDRALKVSLAADKPLAESDLLPKGSEGIHSKLRPGERAMSIKVNPDTAAAGFISPGDKVDVLATVTRTTTPNEQPRAETILQDVEVLAVDDQMESQDGGRARKTDRVTLRVTLEEAQALAVFADTGTLRLVVRRPDDAQQVQIGSITSRGGRPKAGYREASQTEGSASMPELVGTPLAPPTLPDPKTPITEPTEPAKPRDHTMTIINGGRISKYKYDQGQQEPGKGPK